MKEQHKKKIKFYLNVAPLCAYKKHILHVERVNIRNPIPWCLARYELSKAFLSIDISVTAKV
jgi:hypothetical protein